MVCCVWLVKSLSPLQCITHKCDPVLMMASACCSRHQVTFNKGFFRYSLPTLRQNLPVLQTAVLRLVSSEDPSCELRVASTHVWFFILYHLDFWEHKSSCQNAESCIDWRKSNASILHPATCICIYVRTCSDDLLTRIVHVVCSSQDGEDESSYLEFIIS